MRAGRRGSSIALFLLLAVFAAGVAHLFLLRFSSGDMFPAYSSLRSDPLGVKVLYESLKRMPGITVLRNFDPRGAASSGPGVAVFILGARIGNFERIRREETKVLEEVASGGGRLVIAFFPESGGNATGRPHLAELEERWGFRFSRAASPDRSAPVGSPEIPWRSTLVFDNVADAWQVRYEREGRPVLIERGWGKGTIVLSADSYVLSNEAMRRHRRPAFLARLAGECGTIVFDESHLGVVEPRTVASLARKYRLHGLLAGILLLSFLYVWMQSSSFVHATRGESAANPEDSAAGRDSGTAFTNLLRRNIPPESLLEVCFEEWSRSLPRHGTTLGNKPVRARNIVKAEMERSPRERDPLKGYRAITRILRGEDIGA